MLGALPALIQCKLNWRHDQVLRVTPTTFCSASGITRLVLQGHDKLHKLRLQLLPHSLDCFKALSILKLMQCTLTSIPVALSGVGHSLQELCIRGSDELQIDKPGLEILLSLSELKSLYLKKGLSKRSDSVRPVQAPWTWESMQLLCSFQWQWHLKYSSAVSVPELSV